jgi:hypothetical protein
MTMSLSVLIYFALVHLYNKLEQCIDNDASKPCGATSRDEAEGQIHAPWIRWLLDSEFGRARSAVISRSLECVNFAAANELTSYQSTRFFNFLDKPASFLLSKKLEERKTNFPIT